ncbi:hypothetical protein EDB86DRAFT_3246503 [Lactarius hatsudake]|nr:hypothetical protein EDB86DRAFT_3246503 [Lactarius hatsudake]
MVGQEEEGEGARGREGGGGSGRVKVGDRGRSRESANGGDPGEDARNVWERRYYACSAGEGDGEAKKGWACRGDCRQWDGREYGDDDKQAVVGRETWEARRKGTGGAEGRGDGSTGRETEAERERPRRESFTCDREEGFGRKEGRVPKCQRAREEHGARLPGKGAPGKVGQGEDHRSTLARTKGPLEADGLMRWRRWGQGEDSARRHSGKHEKRSTLAARAQLSNIVLGATVLWTAATPRGSATCNNRSTISSVPEMISMRPDKELSARIEIVSVWWSGDAALRGKGSESCLARKLNV